MRRNSRTKQILQSGEGASRSQNCGSRLPEDFPSNNHLSPNESTPPNARDISQSSWLDRQQLATRYNISVRLVDYLRKAGVLPYYKISKRAIRFCPEETDKALARFRRKAIGE